MGTRGAYNKPFIGWPISHGSMIDPLTIFAVAVSLISLLLTFYLSKKQSETLKEAVFERLTVIKGEFEEVLQPILVTNSRAMGAISGLSNETKMDQALERRIGQDLMGQNEDVLEVIKMAFPSVSEYIDEHPEAVVKLMPRLNQLLKDPEARKRLNLDAGGPTTGPSKAWSDQ